MFVPTSKQIGQEIYIYSFKNPQNVFYKDQDTHFMATGLDLTVMIDSIDLSFPMGNR